MPVDPQPVAPAPQATQAGAPSARTQASNTYQRDDLIGAAEGVFGKGASGLAGIIEEWLFRGLLLGVWLRIAKPMSALLSVSFIFAVVHFLQPPADYPIANSSSPFAGFQLLGGILQHFLDPRFIAAELALLFVLGIVLGSNRLRTGSLCVPIGLHAGFVFAFKSFNLLYDNADTALRPLWIGESLRSGLLPLATLILAGAICRFVFRSRKHPNNPPVSH